MIKFLVIEQKQGGKISQAIIVYRNSANSILAKKLNISEKI
jgi:hypothetical protein